MSTTVPIELTVYIAMGAGGTWEATSDKDELAAIVTASPGGCVVQTVKIKLEMEPPSFGKPEVEAASGGPAIAALVG